MRDELDAEIGRRLREARIVRGMSQTELGDALGITFQQIQKYEKGLNRIGSGRLFKISRILQLPVTYFYDGLEEAAKPQGQPLEADEALATKTIRIARMLNELPDGEIKESVFKLIRSFARAG
ncbi:MAG: helix-turn-helix domain-containing protein [Tistlia sp.]